MRFSFFHAADLHLGAASEGVTRGAPDKVRKAVESCTYRAFENLIADAERERPAFILFPGDLYNTADGNLRARIAFRNGVSRLGDLGIASFAIRGNHDPLVGEDELPLPDSCHLFPVRPEQPVTALANGKPIARIYGESYANPRVAKNLSIAYPKVFPGEDGLLQIAMLHGNLLGEKSLGAGERNAGDYAPFSLNDLASGGYDYWALGHVHMHRVLDISPRRAVYTGSLQGVSPRERGKHGYVRVAVNDTTIDEVEFRVADVLRWAEVEVDLTGIANLDDISARIETTIRELLEDAEGRPIVLRLHLVGETDLDAKIRQDDFAAHMEALQASYGCEDPFAWIETWSVRTRPAIDWAVLKESSSLEGFLLRLASYDEDLTRADLIERLNKEAGRTRLDPFDPAEFDALLGRAATHAVSLLTPGAES